jgi:hypothetical protein
MIREQRQVGLRTIFDLLKQKPGHLIFGTMFTLIPFFFGGLFLLIFSFAGSDSPEVDYKLVDTNGTTTQATISNIEVQGNISINNEHPRVISYSYQSGDKLIDDKFRVLDSAKVSRLKIGDTIRIKHYNGQTIIADLKPYAFPTNILLLVLTPILVIGLIALGLLYWRIKRQIDLFKSGKITNAEIVSMTPVSGLPISGIGQRVKVHYQYLTANGQKLLGESATTDYTILTSKKQGDSIKIFVSPDNEEESCVFSRLDEIRNNWKIS